MPKPKPQYIQDLYKDLNISPEEAKTLHSKLAKLGGEALKAQRGRDYYVKIGKEAAAKRWGKKEDKSS